MNDSADSEKKTNSLTKKLNQLKRVEYVFNDDVDIEKDKSKQKKTPIKKTSETPEEYFINLPIEIWILISQQIRPEDVATFSLICRHTYSVVNSAQFWFALYKRFFRPSVEKLPMRLQPESMVRLGGLRAAAIRSLFFTYEPFVKRKQKPFYTQQLENLSKKQKIIRIWFYQVKEKLWRYLFKLQKNTRVVVKTRNSKQTNYEEFVDIMNNPEKDCQILVIESPCYQPPLSHNYFDQPLFLENVTITLSCGFKTYKLRLILSPSSYNSNLCTNLVFDPVISYSVLNWWDQIYFDIQNNRAVEGNEHFEIND